jgi:subtilase family serine protease
VGAGTPDLVIQEFAAQNQVREGNAMGVDIRTRNVAAGLATASITRLYLSTDQVADPGDISIRDTAVGALQGNEEHYTAFVITLPIVPLGQYYLLAVTDAGNTVPEANEGNNTRYSRIHIKRAQ